MSKKASPGSTPVDQEGAADRSGDAVTSLPGESGQIDLSKMSDQMQSMAETIMAKMFAKLPGAAALLKGFRQPKEEKKSVIHPAMNKLRELDPEDEGVTLTLKPDGPLKGVYNSAVMSIRAGDHEGIPTRLANRLADEHPDDFEVA